MTAPFDFVDHPAKKTAVTHSGALPPRLGYYLVHYSLYEGDGYLLISQRTGELTGVAAAPVFSPDSTRLVIASVALEAAYNPTLLQIYKLTKKGLQKEFSEEPINWGPANARWLDSVTVEFDKQELIMTTDSSSNQTTATLLLQKQANGKWRVESRP